MSQLLEPRAAALRRMKRVALSLLLLMFVLFVAGLLLQGLWPAFAYLRAAAEGGMVGALADWFAVTALFRHPLGLPIPHTNLIQRKKDELGASLGSFVQENFLNPAVVGRKLLEARLLARAGGYLASRPGADAASTQLRTVARGMLDTVDDEQVLPVLQALARDYMVAPQWSTTLGTLGAKLVQDGHHEAAVQLLAQRAQVWVAGHPEVFREVVTGRSPSWVPRVVDELLAQKIHRELGGVLSAVAGDRDHPLRRAVTDWLAGFTRDMQSDPATIAKVEQFKHSLLGDRQLRELAVTGWGSLKAGLDASLADPDSPLCRALNGAVQDFGRRLLRDRALRQSLEARLVTVVQRFTAEHGQSLAALVSDTVRGWDPAEASAKLELQVGRDLQFIRINGTVIGALAGVAIYAGGQLILLLAG